MRQKYYYELKKSSVVLGIQDFCHENFYVGSHNKDTYMK